MAQIVIEGAVLIQGCSLNSLSLLASLAASTSGAILLSVESSEKSWIKRYPVLQQKGVKIKCASPDVQEISRVCASLPAPSCIFIDAIDLLLDYNGVNQVAALISEVKDKHNLVLHSSKNTSNEGDFNCLKSMADSVISLRSESQGHIIASRMFRKNGKEQNFVKRIRVMEDLRLVLTSYETTAAASSNQTSIVAAFDVGLSLKESEQKAKNDLTLPYTKAQSEEASDKKLRVGGQVIYTPDEADDLDGSDPDDDLEF